MNKKSTLLIMTGISGDSKPERILNEAYAASTFDLAEKGVEAENIGKVVVSTNSTFIAEKLENRVHVELDSEEKKFHFGDKFKEILKKYEPSSLLYFSGGSGVLFDVRDLDEFSRLLLEREGAIVANNFYSSDFVGLNPASKILEEQLPDRDNMLGWKSRGAGYEPFELKRSAKTQYDIDTPLDLIPLSITDVAENNLEETLKSLWFKSKDLEEIVPLLTDAQSSITFVGRIGSSTWNYLEKTAACETNIVSEGRGLYASGSKDRSSKEYIANVLLEEKGMAGALDCLLGDSEALFLDTRVLYAGRGMWPSAPDRFWSDLKEPEKINDEFVRDLTRASMNFDQPLVLCGHSMISGAMYLLADMAWELVEPKSKRVQPKTLSLKQDGR